MKSLAFTLYYAIKHNDLKTLENALKSGVDLEKASNDPDFLQFSNQALLVHIAIKHGNMDILNLFKKYHVNFLAKTIDNGTFLHYGVYSGNPDVVRFCIDIAKENNLSLNPQTDFAGTTPVHLATLMDRPDLLTMLTDEGADLETADFGLGERPVHIAISHKLNNVLKFLLSKKVDFNAQSLDGDTPAYVAAECGNIEALVLLHDLGADLEKTNNDRETPAIIALKMNRIGILSKLNEWGVPLFHKNDKNALIFEAVLKEDKEALSLLLQNKALANCQDGWQRTPAHFIAGIGNQELFDLLLRYDADLEAKDCEDRTPIHTAVENEQLDMVRYLIKRRVKLDTTNFKGESLIHTAVKMRLYDILEELAKAKANLSIPTHNQVYPVQIAVERGDTKALEILGKYHADFSVKKRDFGYSLAHTAIKKGSIGCVNILLKNKAPFDTLDILGQTPLHYLALNFTYKNVIIWKLLKNKVKLDVKNAKGLTPLDIVKQSGNQDYVAFLEELMKPTTKRVSTKLKLPTQTSSRKENAGRE